MAEPNNELTTEEIIKKNYEGIVEDGFELVDEINHNVTEELNTETGMIEDREKKRINFNKEKEYIVPKIGTKGTFIFHPPFNKPDYKEKLFTVESVTSLKMMDKNNEDPLNIVYKNNELELDDFMEDYKNDVPVLVLETEGNFLYVPANRIAETPNLTGVPYTARAITFKLGFLPDELSLKGMYEKIKDIIKTDIAVDPEVKETPYSDTVLEPEERHLSRMKYMYANGKTNKSFKTLYYELLQRHKIIVEEKALLEKTINKMLTEKTLLEMTEDD